LKILIAITLLELLKIDYCELGSNRRKREGKGGGVAILRHVVALASALASGALAWPCGQHCHGAEGRRRVEQQCVPAVLSMRQAGHVSDIHITPRLGVILRVVSIIPSASISRSLKVSLDANLDGGKLCYYGLTPDSNGNDVKIAFNVRVVLQ
jgi:hypothetical protein